jgi:hypothetical protein
VIRRIKCWFNGHEYVLLTPATKVIWGDKVNDYIYCLRCHGFAGGRLKPLEVQET